MLSQHFRGPYAAGRQEAGMVGAVQQAFNCLRMAQKM
jgi:hypothetical protein